MEDIVTARSKRNIVQLTDVETKQLKCILPKTNTC